MNSVDLHLGAVAVFFSIILAAVFFLSVTAQAGNTTADLVLGQVDYTHNGANIVDGRALYAPAAVVLDRSTIPNRIYVADYRNNRVLGWRSSRFANGEAADLVIGQPDFLSTLCNNGGVSARSMCEPAGVAVDSAGNLYVADSGNNRVLEYNRPYSEAASAGVGGHFANRVFGQSNFTSTLCSAFVSATTLCGPVSVAVDQSNNLFIADSRNNRIVEYNTPLTLTSTQGSGDTAADTVFGQIDLRSAGCNFGSKSIAASSLCMPEGEGTDENGNLYIADTQNNRVLEYNAPLLTRRMAANVVFGQTRFSSNTCNSGGTRSTPGPNSLCAPRGVATDRAGDLYVSDTGNRRVLEYITPLAATFTPGSGDTTADLVFGQRNNFRTTLCNLTGWVPTASSLCSPQGVATDNAGNLYIADTGNGRLLEYKTPPSATIVSSTRYTKADGVLGKLDFVHGGANIVSASGLYFPLSVAVDTTVVPNHVYIADSSNNRVLGWRDEGNFANGAAADMVFGQPDFLSSAINQGRGPGATTLNFPEGLAVDTAGNLWVADTNNSRILEFNTPYVKSQVSGSGDTAPDFVLGQMNYTTGGCNGPITNVREPPPNNSFCQAVSVTLDNAGNLYASDANNNRVLEWNRPLATGNALPSMVFGQPNFSSDLCNTAGQGSPPSAGTLCTPEGLAVDASGNLYLADHLNNRLLEFTSPVVASSTTPRMVFGQSNYASSTVATGRSGLNAPRAAAIDKDGNLYISDTFNHRVLEFSTPAGTGTKDANMVFGQLGSFNSAKCNLGGGPTANDLCRPSGVSVDSAGNLYVADAENNRVLEFNQPLGSTRFTKAAATAPIPAVRSSQSGPIGSRPAARSLADQHSTDNLSMPCRGSLAARLPTVEGGDFAKGNSRGNHC